IQSFGQLQKNYGKEGAEIIVDNCQLTLFGGFAPNSETAEVLSKSLGTRTVLSGSVSRSKNEPSQSLQMMERPLMTADELKALKRGNFIVTKTGFYPMRTILRLFLEWGISFDKPYTIPERANRRVYYADKNELEYAIYLKHKLLEDEPADFESEDGVGVSAKSSGGMADTPQSHSKKKSRGQQPTAPIKTE
ncbi:MAG: TraG/TraD/VirD4 family protein, partial [Oscillospiraceae bacterium]